MSVQVTLHQLEDLAHEESPNEILIDTKQNTQLHILSANDRTVIKFSFGNKFDLIDGMIIIHEK